MKHPAHIHTVYYNGVTYVVYSTHNIILPVVLYGCETWSLTLREECRLRVFENRMLMKIFGPTRDEVTGEWRKQICSHQVLFG
jgi:hypothetical protein